MMAPWAGRFSDALSTWSDGRSTSAARLGHQVPAHSPVSAEVRDQSVKVEMFETGIKVCGPVGALPARAADRAVRWGRGRQDRGILELINNVAKKHGGYSVFAGVGSAPRGTRSLRRDDPFQAVDRRAVKFPRPRSSTAR